MAQVEESLLDTLKRAIDTNTIKDKARAAGNWFRTVVKRAKGNLSGQTPEKMISGMPTVSNYKLGHMYAFMYNPKHRETLPYYDMFPLIFPVEVYSDGFLGVNFHYLDPGNRAVLMDQLSTLRNTDKFDERTKLKLTYKVLQRYARAKPCVKRYLNAHKRSPFVDIHADEWEVAIFLPVERFKKQNKKAVWAESKKIFQAGW